MAANIIWFSTSGNETGGIRRARQVSATRGNIISAASHQAAPAPAARTTSASAHRGIWALSFGEPEL